MERNIVGCGFNGLGCTLLKVQALIPNAFPSGKGMPSATYEMYFNYRSAKSLPL